MPPEPSHAAPRVVAVVQARTGSHRLPGKVLLPLAGRPVLGWVVRAARAASGVDEVVVATSTAPGDDAVADLATSLGVAVVRGSEDDVLSRFVLARDTARADAVVRLTADCPLLDPALIGLVAAAWRAAPDLDYVATTLVRTLPRGLDVELVSAAALDLADARATDHDRVHVTSWLYGEPGRCRTLGLVVTPDAHDLRVTLDTPEDARLLAAVADELGDAPPAWRDLVALLRSRPDLREIVADVRQKSLEEG
ncbi:cytidylyltransferase domain-containing protein [Cellulomonas carbonis]|uniref:Acylneuraminate cytidylyltransferase n=1 Tax=Cellulomonas carbonis T26 TaxID=947969 RepID=A0A0A0BLJ5_9CELL|nr:glycosyltransferase family protein [Cellulomonas carbonis]KGM08821.1 acylneuraminate cytidylyltransferase [Cellulomonas carbonis T26]GGC11357.1 flagellin modification protein FlmC [Cellulomonas carbonis]